MNYKNFFIFLSLSPLSLQAARSTTRRVPKIELSRLCQNFQPQLSSALATIKELLDQPQSGTQLDPLIKIIIEHWNLVFHGKGFYNPSDLVESCRLLGRYTQQEHSTKCHEKAKECLISLSSLTSLLLQDTSNQQPTKPNTSLLSSLCSDREKFEQTISSLASNTNPANSAEPCHENNFATICCTILNLVIKNQQLLDETKKQYTDNITKVLSKFFTQFPKAMLTPSPIPNKATCCWLAIPEEQRKKIIQSFTDTECNGITHCLNLNTLTTLQIAKDIIRDITTSRTTQPNIDLLNYDLRETTRHTSPSDGLIKLTNTHTLDQISQLLENRTKKLSDSGEKLSSLVSDTELSIIANTIAACARDNNPAMRSPTNIEAIKKILTLLPPSSCLDEINTKTGQAPIHALTRLCSIQDLWPAILKHTSNLVETQTGDSSPGSTYAIIVARILSQKVADISSVEHISSAEQLEIKTITRGLLMYLKRFPQAVGLGSKKDPDHVCWFLIPTKERREDIVQYFTEFDKNNIIFALNRLMDAKEITESKTEEILNDINQWCLQLSQEKNQLSLPVTS